MPSMADALLQCPDDPSIPGYEGREAAQQKAVRLARLQPGGGKLVAPIADALRLLSNEVCNSYALRDGRGVARGFVVYPQASLINHSCVPNVACIVDGPHVTFEALRPIAAGEEVLQCYLRIGAEGEDGSTAMWGFTCTCPR